MAARAKKGSDQATVAGLAKSAAGAHGSAGKAKPYGLRLTTEAARIAAEAERLQLMEEAVYEAAEGDLYTFFKAVWPIIEPGRPFIGNWHLKGIAATLQRAIEDMQHSDAELAEMGRKRVNRVIVNLPFRTGKSSLISVAFPVWSWCRFPRLRWLTGSHSDKLSTRDAVRSRRLLQHPWFTKRWGDRFEFLSDTNQKTRYENDKTGYRISFGMTSGVTGEGGDVLMLDDPNNSDAMYSEADRQHVNDTYDQGLSTRLNDAERSVVIVVMQRFHVDDLCGHLLESGNAWTHIKIPMMFDPDKRCEVPEVGFRDPRTTADELMWEKRFPQKWVDDQKRNLGSIGQACQFQQEPVPAEGGMINIAWFQRFNALPPRNTWVEVINVWDTAQKADELTNAPWVGGTWVLTSYGYYLVRVTRRWMTYPEGKRTVQSEYEWARNHLETPSTVLIEDKSTGASLLQELRAETTIPVLPFEPEKDKVTRMGVETPAIEAGNVWLPEVAEWLSDFEREASSFPNSTTKDQVDMLSMSLRFIRDGNNAPRIRQL